MGSWYTCEKLLFYGEEVLSGARVEMLKIGILRILLYGTSRLFFWFGCQSQHLAGTESSARMRAGAWGDHLEVVDSDSCVRF